MGASSARGRVCFRFFMKTASHHVQFAEILIRKLLEENDLSAVRAGLAEVADCLRAARKAEPRKPRETPRSRALEPLWGSGEGRPGRRYPAPAAKSADGMEGRA
jgi:hypothetical protein